MPKTQYDVNVANCVATDIANDVFPVLWMEVHVHVYPFCFFQISDMIILLSSHILT